MKPIQFDYARPSTVDEAVALLRSDEDAKVIAGGQSLIPLLNLRLARPTLLVDTTGIDALGGVHGNERGISIGASKTEAAILALGDDVPALVRAAVSHIGHFQIRNRGTVGGSLCHLDPSAEWPALALALGATLTIAGPNGFHDVAASDFMLGPLWSAVEHDEILVSVTLPLKPDGWGFAEIERRDGDFAQVGAVAVRRDDDWTVVAFATGTLPHRLQKTEEHLRSGGAPGTELARIAASEIQVTGDIHASADYRRVVGSRLVERVVEQACT